MYILSFKTGHDPAACLLKDGKLVAAIEEERFSRVKHAPAQFPKIAIEYCLTSQNIKIDDVDFVVFAREKNFKTFLKVFRYFIAHPPVRNWSEFRYAIAMMHVQFVGLREAILQKTQYQAFRKVTGWKKKIYSFDHHLCHVSSAYFGSGFKEASILTTDGKGEATSIALAYAKDGEIKILKRYGFFHSLGMLYSAFTEMLGFRPNDGEYKVMGLAPYGKPVLDFDDIIKIDDSGVKMNTKYFLHPSFSQKNLKNRFGNLSVDYQADSRPNDINANIAATLQDRLEKAIMFYVKEILSKTGCKNLALAGGVALNVKMNKAVWESGAVEKMFIQPAAGDMGNVLGAAWLLYFLKTREMPEPLKHLYLGSEFSKEEIEAELKKSGFKYRLSPKISEEAAEMLNKGMVIAWFSGRMEFGPRALGARSILADSRRNEMKDLVNLKVKFREPFRPFCPSFLAGTGEMVFKKYMPSPYMIMSFDVKEEWRNKIPAVVHIDNTARPQEVYRETNLPYYNLIKRFYELTGVPVILNTSLNVRGEPIIRTPAEALNLFRKTEVDVLAIDPFLVFKK